VTRLTKLPPLAMVFNQMTTKIAFGAVEITKKRG